MPGGFQDMEYYVLGSFLRSILANAMKKLKAFVQQVVRNYSSEECSQTNFLKRFLKCDTTWI